MSASLTPAGFNRTAKNGENRAGARYEPRRNFKGDDSPNGTDLSARLSFAKRAREVKAVSEAAVFKEDYPRDDKSIEDDERPNRSRVSEPLGAYRKSISDGEKSGEETDERPGDIGDTGDARTSLCAASERPRALNERRNGEVVYRETGCGPATASTAGIKRKRISRGVQCCHSHPGRSLFSCLESGSRRRSLARRARRRAASANKFDAGSRNEAKRSPNAGMINDESRGAIKEEPMRDTDTKREEFGKIGEEQKIEGIAGGHDEELRMQSPRGGEKSKDNDDSRCRKVKRNLLEMLRLRRAPMRREDDSEAGGSPHEPRNREGEIAGLDYEGERNVADNSRNVEIIDRQMDSSDGRKVIATASIDRGGDVNKIKERLDSCIAELNGIIGDACAIFGNRRNGARNNGRGC